MFVKLKEVIFVQIISVRTYGETSEIFQEFRPPDSAFQNIYSYNIKYYMKIKSTFVYPPSVQVEHSEVF